MTVTGGEVQQVHAGADGTAFGYPVVVLLFNRPEYARTTLESLRDQTLAVPEDRLLVSVDGYAGSKDEALGRADRTAEVAELAREMFPGATVRRAPGNLGIARHFALVEQLAFADEADDWAVFFEEDFVLAPTYLDVLSRLIDHVGPEWRVVQVSATGDTMLPERRDTDVLVPMFHAWAFALRRSHYLERKGIIDAYLEACGDVPYYQRDHDAVIARLVDFGIYPIGSAQDRVKQSIRKHFGRLALTTGRAYGRYIGVEGEHFTPETFTELGYDDPPDVSAALPDLADAIASMVPGLVREEQRAWSRELNVVWEDRLRTARSDAEARAAEAGRRLADAEADARRSADEVSALRARLAETEARLEASEREVHAMRASRSWRATAGLRTLGEKGRSAAPAFLRDR